MTRASCRGAIAAAVFLALAAVRLSSYYPPMPSPLRVDLRLDADPAPRADPLVVLGRRGTGSILSVRVRDERTIVFGYDLWGQPGILSHPVRFTPNQPLRLEIEMPALTQVPGGQVPFSTRVRVRCDGATVLEAESPCHLRGAEEIHFGENPLGGTACGAKLHGTLTRVDDQRTVHGGVDRYFTWRDRFTAWFTRTPLHPLTLLALGLAVAWLATRARGRAPGAPAAPSFPAAPPAPAAPPRPEVSARPAPPGLCALHGGAAAIAGLAVLAALALTYSREHYPPTPGTLGFEVVFPAPSTGESEPFLITGMYGEGDLLVVRVLDPSTVVFAYDHWGHGGPASEPIRIQPGARHAVRVTMPSLTMYHKPPPGALGRLEVVLDGRPVLTADVPFYGRQHKQVFVGRNIIGGSSRLDFLGEIRVAGGRPGRGGPEVLFSYRERLREWARAQPRQVVGVVATSGLAGLAVGWLVLRRWFRSAIATVARGGADILLALPTDPTGAAASPADAHARRASAAWFGGVTALATLGYAWVVTGGSFEFDHEEVFGSFYDFQAASLLTGRLDVPEEAIGGEAFEARGKLYGYFGPTPALLRLPFVATGVAFGKLSRAFMVAYFVACLVATHLLLLEARRFLRRGAAAESGEPPPSSTWSTVVLLGSAGLGSTILFLGSRGLIFHEAILAGITFALWSSWCALRYLRCAGRWWVGAWVCGLLSLHARPTTGLFALSLLGCVALLRVAVAWFRGGGLASCRAPLAVAALCVVGFATLNGMAWLKFRTFDPAPLRISRPYFTPGRLEHIEGKSFHLVNIPYNVDTYLLFPNFRFERTFPWFYLVSPAPRRDFPNAKIDLPDHTLALPYAMPSLFALATLGCLGAFAARPGARAPVAALWAAALPMSLALFAAVATAQRYTGDFVPFLVAAAAFGLAAAEAAPPLARRLLATALIALTAAAIAINAAMTLYYQGEILWGVPEEIRQNFQRLRQRADRSFSGFLP